MRKFLFNGSMISTVFGGISALQATRQGPRDWKLALLWVSWGISLALAISSVIDDSKQAEIGR
ncbi:hypothetical protein A4X17_05430 [Plantibacter sp. H53]|uniref:hypothetical protein n=1 Tax=Plantibacter TaxID=190323 RepID=UPI0007D8D2B8|nr:MULTISPECIES: hypothetical protein [Plantibacter]AQX79908.1 hypothetical protein BWO91_07825 [Plantibacter flavus]OAN29028.1 hypothetical protein A4X17_05430 [Plantibacter sp. H53]